MTAPTQTTDTDWDEILIAAQCFEEFKSLYTRFFAADVCTAGRIARQIDNTLAYWRALMGHASADPADTLRCEALRVVRERLA